MRIKIRFEKARTEDEKRLIYTFCEVMLEEIDDIILRTPEYFVKGDNLVILTLCRLSPIEGARIYPHLINERNGGIVERVTRYNNPREELQPENYQSMQPEYTELGSRQISEKKRIEIERKGLDIGKLIPSIVDNAVRSATDQLYNEYRVDTGDDSAPWTMKAIYRHYEIKENIPKALAMISRPEDPDFIISSYEEDMKNGFFDEIPEGRRSRRSRISRSRNPRRINGPR